MRAPILQRPVYLSGASPSELAPTVRAVCEKASVFGPVAGVIGGAVIGAVASYFAPKVLDRYFKGPESPEVDLDVED